MHTLHFIPVNSGPEGAFLSLKIPRARINVIPKGPVIIESVTDLNGKDCDQYLIIH